MRRVGILGGGYMGAIRRDALRRRADAEVARVFDGAGDGWREVVDDPTLDAIFVCLPSALTREATCRALAADKDVLAEKPPGVRVDDVRAMAAAEVASGRRLKLGFNHRHHPAYRAAKVIVDEGELGALRWLRGRYGKPMDPGFEEGWRARRALAGGGILLDQGIHLLDLMRDLAGGFDEVEAYAATWGRGEVEDDVVAILRQRGGPLATLASSHTQHPPLLSLEIGLERGSLEVRGLLSKSGRYGSEQLLVHPIGAASRVETFSEDDSWDREIDELFGEAPIRIGTTDEALALMRLVEAMYASAGIDGWTSSSGT